MTTTPSAFSPRPSIAARATPHRFDSRPASQVVPRAKMPQPTAATGPSGAPAARAEPSISSRRSGSRDSKATIPTDQQISAPIRPRSTRLRASSSSPPLMTAGASMTEARARRSRSPTRQGAVPP